MSNNLVIVKEGKKTFLFNPQTGERVRILGAQKYSKRLARMSSPAKNWSRVKLHS